MKAFILSKKAKDIIKSNIKDFMELHRLSLAQMADMTETTRQNIHNIINDKSSPSMDLIDKMSSAMGCEVKDLFTKDYFSQFEVKIVKKTK